MNAPIYADCPACNEPTPFIYGENDGGAPSPYTCKKCGSALVAEIDYAFNGEDEYPVLSVRKEHP